jgi:hypothetical protein
MRQSHVNFKLADLTRALIAAGRAGTPVREVTIDGAGKIKLSMQIAERDQACEPPTRAELEAEKAEIERLVAADKP